MNFFKTVFSEDLSPSDSSTPQSQPPDDDASHSTPNPSSGWSFGVMLKTLTRDLEEFGSGLKKETALIREVASRAVQDIPGSLEVGASVAHGSLESVGQAIDGIGTSVWKSTTEIISHGRDTLLAPDLDSDSSDSNRNNRSVISKQLSSSTGLVSDSKRYSRFDAQLGAIQGDMNTYLEEPEDLDSYNEWKKQFVLEEKGEEIENMIAENGVIAEIYEEVVPGRVEKGIFWSRYFYRVHKLKQAEDARAKLVKRAISGEEEEDLTWDYDDEAGDHNESEPKAELSVHDNVENVEVGSERANDEQGDVKLEMRSDEKVVLEGKTESVESERESDVSVVSNQQVLPEEEDLGWDEIEDIGSNDENKGDAAGRGERLDLHKRLSVAEEEEDLNWDVDDDDDDDDDDEVGQVKS
ncbi:BSD domain-containing protein 1 [Morella rubra]|uniref:BSD domain-containing protein 1 n=1 Tax=Morella rubra TaxID=262757 RepID=A0A6A1VMP2_9ROSI|nr:BSD domain-containing protein 1 [Morella rubra]